MAWETCKWCGQKLNGYTLSTRHYDNEHPLQYAISKAETALTNAVRCRDESTQKLAEYRILSEFLARPDLPELVSTILAGAQRKRGGQYYADSGQTDEEALILRLQIEEEGIVKAQEKLAALQVTA